MCYQRVGRSVLELAQAKEKYVSTLRKMRDELAANRKASWERLETEWLKRKQNMNQEWHKR